MMNEIETRKEIPYKDVCETFKKICKRYGFEVDALNNANTKYARVSINPEGLGFDVKRQVFQYKAVIDCSIRFMGNLTIEEMNQASEDIKAATVIAQYMTDKLEGKIIVVTA